MTKQAVYKGYHPEQKYCENPHPDTGPIWFITEDNWYWKMGILDKISKTAGYKVPTREELNAIVEKELEEFQNRTFGKKKARGFLGIWAAITKFIKRS